MPGIFETLATLCLELGSLTHEQRSFMILILFFQCVRTNEVSTAPPIKQVAQYRRATWNVALTVVERLVNPTREP